MKTSSVVLLLDSAPLTWTSQEDRHFRLCQALSGRGVTPVLVFAEPLRPHIADSVEHLAQDGRLRQEMGHRAVERVRRNFTVGRDVEKTLGTYALLGG